METGKPRERGGGWWWWSGPSTAAGSRSADMPRSDLRSSDGASDEGIPPSPSNLVTPRSIYLKWLLLLDGIFIFLTLFIFLLLNRVFWYYEL